MDIRKKLTILFLILIASLIVGSSLVVYLWFAEYRQSEFYVRLDKKAKSVAKLLIDVDEVDVNLLRKIEAIPNSKIAAIKIHIKKVLVVRLKNLRLDAQISKIPLLVKT